jgi:hypothetical protein
MMDLGVHHYATLEPETFNLACALPTYLMCAKNC